VHRDCREGTACFIRHLKEREGLSANEVIHRYSKESGIPVKTLERWYWPAKAQPKPKSKEIDQLQKVIRLIEKLSRADLKQLKVFLLNETEVDDV